MANSSNSVGPNLNGFLNAPSRSRSELISSSSAYRRQEHTYSGVDIQAILYIPLLIRGRDDKQTPLMKVFGELQTISISSTRSVEPVRVFGRSSPVAYTRGGRTFAGSMVFTVINKTVFHEIYRPDLAENLVNTTTSLFVDQLPPFSILITASNELGAMCYQLINGITLLNYGTAYSIDDMYTEETYTYVATDVTPMLPIETPFTPRGEGTTFKTVSQVIEEELKKSYGNSYTEYMKKLSRGSPAVANIDQTALNAYYTNGLIPTPNASKENRFANRGASNR